jgi:hypothetical protein
MIWVNFIQVLKETYSNMFTSILLFFLSYILFVYLPWVSEKIDGKQMLLCGIGFLSQGKKVDSLSC